MIVEDGDIKMLDEEEYEILNDKIINLLEDLYLKSFHKEVKKFQIIAAGYNASEQKDLRVFNEYDWNVRLIPIPDTKNNYSAYVFERHILPKMLCWFNVTHNDETNIFESGKISRGYIILNINEKDILYNLIRQLDIRFYHYNYNEFGNEFLKYKIRHRIDGYYLDITCKI